MKRVLLSVVAATALGAAVLAPGGVTAQGAPDGTTLLHAIPGAPVDVYVDGTATFEDFQPGTTQDLTSFAGTTLVDVEIFAAGDDPASDTPLLTTADLPVPASGNNSVVVHNDEAGAPTISSFVNNAGETGTGVGRVTVRHTAAAPAVDLALSNGDRPVLNLVNGGSQEFGPDVGSYDVQLAEAGGGLLAGTSVTIEAVEGENLIVYAAGSLTGGIEYYTESLSVGAVAATTTTDPNATTTTTDPNATTTTTDPAATTTTSTTTTTAAVPVAVNTGSPLDSPLSLTLVAIALGALVVTGGAMFARRRV